MLRIAGLQKVSLVDFPGKICATVFLYGCNMHCPFCHNVLLVDGLAPDRQTCRENYEYVLNYLKHRKNMIDGVCITGGEPTLAGEFLFEFICQIRQMGLAVKLDTNGSRPDVLKWLLDKQILDYVAMDVKTSIGRYNELSSLSDIGDRVVESIRLLKSALINYEFRTTLVPDFVDDGVMKEILELVKGARRYVFQAYRPEFVLDSSKVSDVAIGYYPTVERWVEWAKELVEEVLVRGYGVEVKRENREEKLLC